MPWEFRSPSIHRTPRYRAKAAYRNMKQRCGNANGKNPSYANVALRMTPDEWLSWALPRYKRFLKDHPDQSPSVARKGDGGHYEIGNVVIISVAENHRQVSLKRATGADGKKRCAGCEKRKPLAAYSRNRGRRDGLSYICRACVKKRYDERRAV